MDRKKQSVSKDKKLKKKEVKSKSSLPAAAVPCGFC
jgi:hypothetical protein